MNPHSGGDCIGGFPYADPNCKGCGRPLTVENAWMTDGCPCNSPLGVNSMNETRWRLLMDLQQRQSRQIEAAEERERAARELLAEVAAIKRYDPNGDKWPTSAGRSFTLYVRRELIERIDAARSRQGADSE